MMIVNTCVAYSQWYWSNMPNLTSDVEQYQIHQASFDRNNEELLWWNNINMKMRFAPFLWMKFAFLIKWNVHTLKARAGPAFELDVKDIDGLIMQITRAPFQYLILCLTLRSCKVSKPWDLYLELSNRSKIWQAPWQQCFWGSCQFSKQCDNSNWQSHGFEFSWDFMIRHLIGYQHRAWDMTKHVLIFFKELKRGLQCEISYSIQTIQFHQGETIGRQL